MAATSIGVSNLLLYTSMICWLWFLLVLWTRRPSCQQHGRNHTLIPLLPTIARLPTCLPASRSLYPTILAKSNLNLAAFNHFYLQSSICLPRDLHISPFIHAKSNLNLAVFNHFYLQSSICLPVLWSLYLTILAKSDSNLMFPLTA